ncbi:uncharacterized protein LOC112588330 [Harpegnathos saltator]|uniref:uncharacterized protein LOC112588330 n=1 Tax=Harpegnathos saltator TaxID=610380 RepID=UPI000DBED138|nr:uncharacterized protein LOC112588330 [Harpegnathos saltator]
MVGQAGPLEAEKVRRVMTRGSPPTTLGEEELEDAPLKEGDSYVAVDWGPVTIVGVYLYPRKNKAGLGELLHVTGILDEVGVRQCQPRPVVVAEDFNAHSKEWACSPRQRDPRRGDAVIGWAAGLGLLLMNRGSTSTYVRPNGKLVIDLTWASSSAARIFQEWVVETEGDNLSDHRYIVWALGSQALPQNCEAAAQARRVYTWARRKDGKAVREKEGYRQARDALKAAIAEAKAGAWEQLVSSLDEDPWGRPYKRTVGKIRQWALPPTKSLDPQDLEGLFNTLFSRAEGGHLWIPAPRYEEWTEDLGVSPEELASARKRLGAGAKLLAPTAFLAAPGLSPSAIGTYPKPRGVPICLLDEVGKMLERIIADRLVQHLSSNGPDFHDRQYGFRPGRSTLDTIQHVRYLTRAVVEERGGVLLAVSLDITNAFNTLLWPDIGRALEHHRMSAYLRRILAAYFGNRDLAYPVQGGVQGQRLMERGVPQGSVLGPMLWDIAFDRVAPHKTEVVFFHDGSRGAPPETRVLVDGVRVRVGSTIKYLGLMLDGRWDLRAHFRDLDSQVRKAGLALVSLVQT